MYNGEFFMKYYTIFFIALLFLATSFLFAQRDDSMDFTITLLLSVGIQHTHTFWILVQNKFQNKFWRIQL